MTSWCGIDNKTEKVYARFAVLNWQAKLDNNAHK